MRYLTLDLETTGTETFKRFCNPLDPRHSINIVGYKYDSEPTQLLYNEDNYAEGLDRSTIFKKVSLDKVDIICGQNIKFDMLWLWHLPELQDFFKRGGRIYDTQTVEYLLKGQLGHTFMSYHLDAMALRYGGELKDHRISDMFKAGILTKDIPFDIMAPYAIGDVDNTYLVLQGQLKEIKKQSKGGTIPIQGLIYAYMEHYLAIIEIEYNGLYVDLVELERLKINYQTISANLTNTAIAYVKEETFNPMSNQQLSTFLFGDVRSVDEKSLKKYSGKHKDLVDIILELRSVNKMLKTYISHDTLYLRDNEKKGITAGDIKISTGLKTLVMPHTGCVHSEFKTSYTATARLSSSSPNVQNLPPEILSIFKSRFEGGYIVEIDYSQLEVVIQAFLSQSLQFICDIKDGVDFHCKRLAYAEERDYDQVVALCATSDEWKLKRKAAKTISFQKAYGAMPESIAKETKLPLEVVKRVFEAEDTEYPEVGKFNDQVEQRVCVSRISVNSLINIKNKKTGKYITLNDEFAAYGKYRSITGKLYSIPEKAILTKSGSIFRYFQRPMMQNYPIQGTAADVVASQVGRVFRELALHNRDKFLLINEVHDSLILDVKNEHLDWTIEKVQAILKDIVGTFKRYYKVNFNVPIKVEVKRGKTWLETKD